MSGTINGDIKNEDIMTALIINGGSVGGDIKNSGTNAKQETLLLTMVEVLVVLSSMKMVQIMKLQIQLH